MLSTEKSNIREKTITLFYCKKLKNYAIQDTVSRGVFILIT